MCYWRTSAYLTSMLSWRTAFLRCVLWCTICYVMLRCILVYDIMLHYVMPGYATLHYRVAWFSSWGHHGCSADAVPRRRVAACLHRFDHISYHILPSTLYHIYSCLRLSAQLWWHFILMFACLYSIRPHSYACHGFVFGLVLESATAYTIHGTCRKLHHFNIMLYIMLNVMHVLHAL